MRYILSIIGLAAIVGVGYFTLAQYVDVAHGQSGLLVSDQTLVGASPDGAQVIALLDRLKSVKLNDEIFSNKNFKSLQDRSVAIDPQMTGRDNPYLPVYGSTPAPASNTKVPLPRK